jgi:hypothetical protein
MTPIKCWPAGKTAHQSTATVVYIFCLMLFGFEVALSVAFRKAGGIVGWYAFFETGSGAVDVIGNTGVNKQGLLEVAQHLVCQGLSSWNWPTLPTFTE